MIYTQQEINNFYSKYSCCFASLATDYINSLAIGAFDCGQKLDKLLQFKSYLEILECYKVDTCIINQPLIGTFGPQIDLPEGASAPTVYSFYKNEVLISNAYTIEDIVNYFITLGFGSITDVPFFQPDLYLPLVGWEAGDYDYATQVLYTTNPSLFYTLSNIITATINPPNYTGEPLYATYGDIPDTYDIVWEGSDFHPTITWGKLVLIEENCEEYTEEELNCISNENLDTLLFWMKQQCLNIKNKPTITEVECVEVSENEFSISINDSITIEAGDSIEVSRNGNIYTITNPLPDLEVTIEAGNNIVVTGTYPNFTITAIGGAGGSVDWGTIGGDVIDQTDLITYLEDNYYPLNTNPASYLTENSLMVDVTNAELLAEITAATIVKGVIYRVTDATGGVVQVVGRGPGFLNKAAYREGKVDISTIQKIGIYGTYDPVANTFLEQGRITTQPTVNEDAQHGYYVGQELKTLDTGLTYVCTDNTNTSAVWTLVPGGGGSLDLEVNGTPNVDQTLLNLIEGTNIDITDNGIGGVTINSLADRYSTSSNSTNTINTGNGKIFTVDANLAYIPLQEVLIVNDSTHHMHGTVASYSGTTLVVDVNSKTGTGSFSSWVINLDGVPVDAITGVGVSNQLAYFTSGQVVASLDTATYPSLTELALVKGVSGSAIQTQINGKITNPMTTGGDIIYGGVSGVPTRLAAGTNGHVLTLSSGSPVWAASGGGGGGMTNPMTNSGDIIIGSTSGSPIRLGAGSNGQVLSLASGSPVWSTEKGSFGVTFDGQGGVVSVGKTDWVSIPYNCTITGWEITADQVGNCVIDVWKSTFAAFPPTVANSIAGSEKPTLASVRTNSDLSLFPAWATVTAGDCIMFYVESCSTLTKINLIVYTNIII
jgi:hypothetical protein